PSPAQGGFPQHGEEGGGGHGHRGVDVFLPEVLEDVVHLGRDGGIGAVGHRRLHLFRQCTSSGHEYGGGPHGHAVEENLCVGVPAQDVVDPAHQVQPFVVAPTHVVAFALAVAPLVGHQDVPALLVVV